MKRTLFFMILNLLVVFSVHAQNDVEGDPFSTAKELAFSGEYDAAIEILLDLREAAPGNSDFTLFLARVYSWKKEYPTAIALLKPLTEDGPVSKEAIRTLIHVYIWDEQYEKALVTIDDALKRSSEPFFLINKAKALHFLERNTEALQVLQQVLKKDEYQEEAVALQTRIFKKKEREISTSYRNTSFANPGAVSWHIMSASYKQEIKKLPVVVRYSHGRMHLRDGNQLEIDVYPKISERSYLYLNAGAALDDGVFPVARGGIEYYYSTKLNMDLSLGTKYLTFDGTAVHLFTGQAAYRLESLKFTYRPYVSYSRPNWGWTHTLAFRTSNPLRESFFQVDLQYGTVPYEFFATETFTDLNSLRLGFQYHFRIAGNILLQPILLVEYEEYLPGEYRNRFNTQLLTIFRF